MNVSEILSELEIPTAPVGHHHRTNGWEQIDCPHCSPGSHRWRMGIPLKRGRVGVCWTCGSHSLVESLAISSSRSIDEIRKLLIDFNPTENRRIESLKGKLVVPQGVGPLLPQHRRYLEKRGFDPEELVKLWKISGIGIAPRLSWRIFIPIIEGDKTVTWTTRSLSDSAPRRYRNASRAESQVDRSACLYGAVNAGKWHAVVVVEGPIDVWAIGPGAVSTLGIGYSKTQVLKLSEYPIRVICFDNEPGAQIRAKELCSDLEVFPGEVYNVVMETGKDPSRACKREVEELRNRFLK